VPYFLLALGIFGVIFCSSLIKKPDSKSDLFYAIFSMIGSVIFIALGIFLLVA
jgi:hypothetical protein